MEPNWKIEEEELGRWLIRSQRKTFFLETFPDSKKTRSTKNTKAARFQTFKFGSIWCKPKIRWQCLSRIKDRLLCAIKTIWLGEKRSRLTSGTSNVINCSGSSPIGFRRSSRFWKPMTGSCFKVQSQNEKSSKEEKQKKNFPKGKKIRDDLI